MKEMKLSIHAPWSVNEGTQQTIEEKVEKLYSISKDIIKVDVFLKMKEHSEPHENKIVEIRVSVPGPYLFAEGHGDTVEKAVNNAANKIKAQLVKRKEKLHHL